ncbi:MAG: sigma-70 family RNA polymerase sigma factor [Immundisolibacteraceae bacterium]|nr:sigma-70 family RNA polymerase sigma factor [Immundisolibacteraceae bacterium]
MSEERISVEILNKISSGDESAFADFYRLYESRLYRFICSKLNDSFEASDILHEVFLEVWRKADKFEGRSKVSTWLFGIAYYKTMDRLRKKIPYTVDDEQFFEIKDDAPAQLSCMVTVENAGDVRFCLKTLKDVHRSVMELTFYNELSYREIATIIDCPENTVKTRMFHAKQLIKRCLTNRMGVHSS